MKLNHTANKIDLTIERASKISFNKNSYMRRKLETLKDLREKMNNPERPLSVGQINYVNSLMETFSDKTLDEEENWVSEWESNPKIRERADVVSKYYISQKGWFLDVAKDIQRIMGTDSPSLEAPDWAMTDRMLYNDYAKKVWANHVAPHRWKAGELVCCRANARTEGWGYFNRTEKVDVYKDPCMVIESGSKPISNATKYDEKRGGCRWVSINPIGTAHIFHVMEKDLKIYRQPRNKGEKK
jgi:hypothetical protein